MIDYYYFIEVYKLWFMDKCEVNSLDMRTLTNNFNDGKCYIGENCKTYTNIPI